MNVADPSSVNASEKIIFSFTDQPLTCGSRNDISFLNTRIQAAKVSAFTRVWRMAARRIKAAAGMDRVADLGILITEPVSRFLQQNPVSQPDYVSAKQVLESVNALLPTIGFKHISEDETQELVALLEECAGLIFAVRAIGYLRPPEEMVELRHGGAYDLDTTELTTQYAYHNQRKYLASLPD
jgi:hypothetical protein